MRILLSRTDKIGDVILTLPMAGLIKKHLPDAEIHFLAKDYTLPIVAKCKDIDEYISYERMDSSIFPSFDYFIHVFPSNELARMAKSSLSKIRIGSIQRPYHWTTCNKLVNLSRKKSNLHESQLNCKLLQPLGIATPEVEQMRELIHWKSAKEGNLPSEKFNLIIHPLSGGSSVEWGLHHYLELAKSISGDQFRIYITGSTKEASILKSQIPGLFDLGHVYDRTGTMDLEHFIDFIGNCDGIVAGSTGPLHIAAIYGLKSLGLYPNQKPMHAGRWRPIGTQVKTISSESSNGFLMINVKEVLNEIKTWVM